VANWSGGWAALLVSDSLTCSWFRALISLFVGALSGLLAVSLYRSLYRQCQY